MSRRQTAGYGKKIDHRSGKVLAYVFGRMKYSTQKKLLEPFGISRYYTDGLAAYERHLGEKHEVGKQHMQRKQHINLRTRIKRLVRRTICFPKQRMHDIVIGLFINRYEFGVAV